MNGLTCMPFTSQTTHATYSGLKFCPVKLNGLVDSGKGIFVTGLQFRRWSQSSLHMLFGAPVSSRGFL